MLDLDVQIRNLIDGAAAPVTFEEIAGSRSARVRRPGKVVVAVACAAAVLIVATTATVVVDQRGDRAAHIGVGGPAPTGRLFRVASASMEPTIPAGDRVAVDRSWYTTHEPRRGDIVLLHTPPLDPGVDGSQVRVLVKRILGLPGETVEGRDGRIYVNGALLDETSYLPSGNPQSKEFAPVTLGQHEYFALGDNRLHSLDSTVWGPIDRQALVGRVQLTTTSTPATNATAPGVNLDGWTRTYAQTGTTLAPTTAGTRTLLVISDPKRGFGGVRIKVGIATPPDGFSAGRSAQHVTVDGHDAQLGIGVDKVYLTWSPSPFQTVWVDGTRATSDQVLQIGRGLQLASDGTSAVATSVPDGLELTSLPAPATAPTSWSEYKFERDGAMLQVDFYDGGRSTFEGRVSDPARDVAVRGTTGALRDSGLAAGRYWVDIPDGRWTIEVAGGPFSDQAAFIAVVDALQIER